MANIPPATVARLPLYLRSLASLPSDRPTCSSEELAQIAGVQSAQVRKDLSLVGLRGVRGVGYGYKEFDGERTGEVAIVVYVDNKKTRRYVPVEERIPTEYMGVSTDVVELHGTAREIACLDCSARYDAGPLVAKFLELRELSRIKT